MSLQIQDRVTIIDANGNSLAEGKIVNINDFRGPNQKYAVDIDGYEDVLLFGEKQLAKYQEEE
ncbi:hypothetical protein BLX87_23010 [Bacillus sp. VT-16-64]|nr:hypothetical protein BLX87_23010 [Bacillus sp. VT-16-64]